jgi:hypothetical protein
VGSHNVGPRRSASVDSYLRETRALAAAALLAVIGGVVSDELDGRFWGRHPLLAGLVASVIVVILSVAVVNEAIERRKRQRWSVLAQYVMFGLVRNARLIWTGVLELTRLLPADVSSGDAIDAGPALVSDTPRLAQAVRELLEDAERSRKLREQITWVSSRSNDLLARWAGVMLNADAYAEVIDRHVELAGDIAWLGDLLENAEPGSDPNRRRAVRSSVAVQVEGARPFGEWLVERIVVITQLAYKLDHGTLDAAMRIVPVHWWEERLSTTISASPEPGTAGIPKA